MRLSLMQSTRHSEIFQNESKSGLKYSIDFPGKILVNYENYTKFSSKFAKISHCEFGDA